MTPAEEDARIKTAAEYGCPERIWLQHDPLNTGEPFDESSETTWCQHRIEDTDAEYVRADLHDEAIRSAVAAERERCAKVASNHECGGEDDFICRGINCGSCIAAAIREGEK